MPSLILRPNDLIDAGEWGVNPDTILEKISDNAPSFVINQQQNQSILVTLDNVPSAQSTATFNTITATAITAPTAKGNPAFALSILKNAQTDLFSQTFINSSGGVQILTTDVVTLSGNNTSAEFISSLLLQYTGLSGTQAKVLELFVTVTYTEPILVAGKITLSEGLINLTSGKISIS